MIAYFPLRQSSQAQNAYRGQAGNVNESSRPGGYCAELGGPVLEGVPALLQVTLAMPHGERAQGFPEKPRNQHFYMNSSNFKKLAINSTF